MVFWRISVCCWNRTAYFALSTVLACSLRLLALQRKAIRAICDELEHHEQTRGVVKVRLEVGLRYPQTAFYICALQKLDTVQCRRTQHVLVAM
jgi:hypothetical protein